ncbi:RimK/LysX family protein [Spirosoma knui]
MPIYTYANVTLMRPKQVIGKKDLVDFPDLDLFNVQAKVDTGAYTSALHCKDVRLTNVNGRTLLSFWLIDKTGASSRQFYSDQFSKRIIRNSFGIAEQRYVIKTRIILFERPILTEFTLADRERLKNPVLLGRKLLRNRFVVDVALQNVSYDAKNHQSDQAPLRKNR